MMDALFADILSQGLDLRLKVTGRSMAPFIKNGEIVVLRRVLPGSLRCGDIIYFTDAAGAAVLHRLIAKEIKPDGSTTFITRGDALLRHDAPISKDQIVGKAVRVEKILPLLGPAVLDFDSIFCKWLYGVYMLYRKARHKFINRALLCRVLPTLQ